MGILIKQGRVIDPVNNIDDILDILVRDSKIARVAKGIRIDVDRVIDAAGKIVMPGIVDMHVHLREPGREDKETVASGTQAALKGGVTSVLAMPNTEPVIDCVKNVRLLKQIIKKDARANVFICAAITKGRQGQEITEIARLKREGVIAISDDGSSVEREELLLRALKEAKRCGVLVICHSEDRALSGKGVVNLGIVSTRMGLRGISKESEYRRVERDIQLAQKASARIHIAHVSCAESVKIVKKARDKGVQVTAETAPHYFSLTEDEVVGYDTNFKVNPPLRNRADLEAIREGLREDIIEVIASDHAPHTENEKDIEFEHAAFGITGLETELAVSITELINTKILSWMELVRKLTTNPSRILELDKGTLSVGKDADIIVVDPTRPWRVSKEGFLSKSKNSAFLGRELYGVVEHVICAGKIVFQGQ